MATGDDSTQQTASEDLDVEMGSKTQTDHDISKASKCCCCILDKRWSPCQFTLWCVMTFLCVLVVLMSWQRYYIPPIVFIAEAYEIFRRKVFLYIHIIPSTIALLIGPFNIYDGLRIKYTSTHRIAGRTYGVSCIVGGIGGLCLAVEADGGAVTHVGFGLLGIVWMIFTIIAIYFIKFKNDRKQHKEWMLRSFAMTFAAVTLRLYFPFLSAVFGQEDGYRVVSWLCWVPNLLFIEYYLWYKKYVSENK